MQYSPVGRFVACAVALAVALSAWLVVLAAPATAVPLSAAATRAAPTRAAKTVTVTVRATARATVRKGVRVTRSTRAKVTVKAVSRARQKGKPVGRATVTAIGRGTGSAYAVRSATARATGVGTARATSRSTATVRARARAREHARAGARGRARSKATSEARRAAARLALTRASRHARAKARVSARARAHRLARLRRIDPHDPSTWIRTVPRHYTPPGGARFNNPYAGWTKRRNLLAHVIRSVKSSPGYRLTRDPRTHRRLRCPSNPALAPSEIKIAVYSIADMRFADALVAAHRRCVSVQVLMNSHLTSVTSHSWAKIARALGPRDKRRWHSQRSFAHRCSNGCLGTAVLHSKIYLFSRAGRTRHTVVTGSSNMTRNAVGVQWNDLYTANGDARLYRQFRSMFARMVPDRRARGPYVYRSGRYTSTFYPYRNATAGTDRTMRNLKSISCRGARGGTGVRGRTVVYIAMHAWFTGRGLYLARQVRRLYAQGCHIRILYSFMAYRTFRALKAGTGPRMRVRRVLFAGPLGLRAVKYSHMKMMAVSGRVGRNRAARVVWTGSNNWVDKSLHADEVTLEIRSAAAYRRYVGHWKFMERRRSTAVWALYQEPEGGGRAP